MQVPPISGSFPLPRFPLLPVQKLRGGATQVSIGTDCENEEADTAH